MLHVNCKIMCYHVQRSMGLHSQPANLSCQVETARGLPPKPSQVQLVHCPPYIKSIRVINRASDYS
jgi:hypothetical protein